MLLNQIKCTKTYTGKSNMTSGNSYRITLTYKGRKCSFIFNDNYLNESGKKDLVQCLLMDAEAYNNARDFEDFALEFGYNADSIQAYKIYKACKKQAEKVSRLFTSKEIEQLFMEVEELD